MDRRDRRTPEPREVLEDSLAVFDARQHAALFLELLEFADIGAGDEAVGFARADHHAFRRFDREAFDDLLELLDHVAVEGVDRHIGAVESQYHDAVGAEIGFPVIEAQAFEHGGTPRLTRQIEDHRKKPTYNRSGVPAHPPIALKVFRLS